MTKMGEIATSRAIYIVGKVYKNLATHTVPQLEPCLGIVLESLQQNKDSFRFNEMVEHLNCDGGYS